jgi:transposase-like protein
MFPNDTTLEKLVCLAYLKMYKKWTMPLANWRRLLRNNCR